MERLESSEVLIKRLLSGKSDQKLPHDVKFVFNLDADKGNVEWCAEKLITAVGDEQFAEMFDKSIKRETTPEIHVSAIVPEEFINLLKFVYIKKLKLTNLHSTYAVAKHYSMSDTCKALIKYADRKLSIDHSTLLLDQYCKIGGDCNKKISEVTGIIGRHAFLAIQSKKFLKIDKSTLIRLLESDQLFVQEKDLYYAVLCWINSELQRQGLKTNLKNKSKLFNEFKPLIRFPIMSKHQFFTAKGKCPAKSGLFYKAELDEFEQYFETKDATVLSIGYSTEERAAMKVGVLKLVQNKEDQYEYQMLTGLDEVRRKTETRKDGVTDHLDTYCHIEDCPELYNSVIDYKRFKFRPKPVPAKARRNDLVCGANSIRVFQIHVTGNYGDWEFGDRLSIVENGKTLPTYYKRYTANDMFMYDYWPTVELKVNNSYDFEFICPDAGQRVNKMKLDSVYTKAENGELVLDVKLRIIDRIALNHPTFIYFLYH